MPRGHLRLLFVVGPMAVMVALAVGAANQAAAQTRPCGSDVLLGGMHRCDVMTSLRGSLNEAVLSVLNTNTGGLATAVAGTAKSAGAGVRGVNNGVGAGVRGTANNGTGVSGTSANGTGVSGVHSAATGAAPGVRGDSASRAPAAYGVLGRLTSTAPGINSAGVRGRSAGTNANGSGVFGSHAGAGAGVRGTSTNGTGVFGSHDAASGASPAVEGETRSTAGAAAGVLGEVVPTSPGGFSTGVRGVNNGTGGLGIGVWGSHGGGGWGVLGESPTGIGVNGQSDSGVGVAASTGGSGPALDATNTGGGPAAAFTASGAPFTVSSSTKVEDLNADKLDGRTADEFGRTAVAAVISYSNDETFAEQASIIIDAPRDGLMLVHGAVSINSLIGGDTSCDPCTGVMRLRDEVNDATGAPQVATFGNGTDEAAAQLATSWVFPVEGGRRTFALDTRIEGAAGEIFSDNPTLTALFVPFGPSGGGDAAAAISKEVRQR